MWARHCYRWSDLDFEANKRDSIAVDWPIRYKDIAPWYDYVEQFIGVSGKGGYSPFAYGKFLPPMELNCVEEDFKNKVESKFPDRKITIGRIANTSRYLLKAEGVCQYRNLCHRGCPYGAYFSTNASTLPALLQREILRLDRIRW